MQAMDRRCRYDGASMHEKGSSPHRELPAGIFAFHHPACRSNHLITAAAIMDTWISRQLCAGTKEYRCFENPAKSPSPTVAAPCPSVPDAFPCQKAFLRAPSAKADPYWEQQTPT